MSEFSIPIKWFVDPVTKESLILKNDKLICKSNTYYKALNIWDFRPDRSAFKTTNKWEVWEKLQNNGLISYINDPAHNLGVSDRQDYIDFPSFCKSSGIVLDVGCGPQKLPTHMKHCADSNVEFVGIDPIVGDPNKEFNFILGYAEYLPFVDKLYDQVLFVTTIDHFIDVLPPLIEARRVLKDNGEICIWMGEKKGNFPKPAATSEWYEELDVPEGAVDKFHYKKILSTKLEQCYDQVKLSISEKKVIAIDHWRTSYFYKLKK